jgi:hypothetical protein
VSAAVPARRRFAAGLRLVGFACLIGLGACDSARMSTGDAAPDGPADRLPDSAPEADGGDADRDGHTRDAGADTVQMPPPCTVIAPTSCPDPAPRYADIAPIVGERCVPCHYGMPNGPWPLNSYRHLVDWHDTIPDVLRTCLMPPPDSGMTMTDDERVAILTWLLCGYRE